VNAIGEEKNLNAQDFALLVKALETGFVPHLPPLLPTNKSAEEQEKKNLSRAFSAFALSCLCEIEPCDAGASVIDDFNDFGIDAVYYHASSETLFLVQGKLQQSAQFAQDEALAFCQGVEKLLNLDLDNFNKHVDRRRAEIESAVESCSQIKLVIVHAGSGISQSAKVALTDFLSGTIEEEERLNANYEDFDAAKALDSLRNMKAAKKIDDKIILHKCRHVEVPRLTYFGLVSLEDLANLHLQHGVALYERNIRTFLGRRTPINAAIRETLATEPEDFMFLNNGVTILADMINPKGPKSPTRTLNLRGLSVINGAQTIATAAEFKKENAQADFSKAVVLLTIIKANATGDFAKHVTRARNHQNPVESWNFEALDNEQDRLRRELAFFNVNYSYKAAAYEGPPDANRIHIAEAAQALGMFHRDPRFIIWLKREPSSLLETHKHQYKELFGTGVSALTVLNAVKVNRYIQKRMNEEANRSRGFDRLVYLHGGFAAAWTLAKQTRDAVNGAVELKQETLEAQLGRPFDQLREILRQEAERYHISRAIGPLAMFRNLGPAISVLQEVAIQAYGLSTDPVVVLKKRQQRTVYDPIDYVVSRAPQIRNLA
jgi:hypothetical protein